MAPRKTLGKDDEIKLFYDYGLHIPTRRITVESVHVDPDHGESGVDAHMWSRLEKSLTILEGFAPTGEQDDSITIVMNNPGGDVYHMLAMYDRIRSSPRRIVIEASGYVMSAASISLQAADLRRVHKHATNMNHYGENGFVGHAKDFQSRAEESRRIESIMCEIYLERIRQKQPKFSLASLKRMMNFDCWMSSAKALELGLADEIIPYTG